MSEATLSLLSEEAREVARASDVSPVGVARAVALAIVVQRVASADSLAAVADWDLSAVTVDAYAARAELAPVWRAVFGARRYGGRASLAFVRAYVGEAIAVVKRARLATEEDAAM